MGSLKNLQRELVIAIAGFITGLVLLSVWTSPRLTQTSGSTTVIGASDAFRISFSRPIAPESLPSRFSIEPPIEGSLSVDDNQVIFSPESYLAYDQRYTITLARGIRGTNGLPTLKTYRASHQVAEPQLIFLREIDGRDNLWIVTPNGEVQQLTDEPKGVHDYAVAPDGQGILISTAGERDGSVLILLDRDGNRRELLECRQDQCGFGRWQPEGKLVAFERRSREAGQAGEAEIWLLDTDTGLVRQALDPLQASEIGYDGVAARWSQDGRYLAYFNRPRRVVVIKDMAENQVNLVPANLDIMTGWSPVENVLAYTELTFATETSEFSGQPDDGGINHEEGEFFSHIVLVDVIGESVLDLNAGQAFNFGRVAWHPDGSVLAAPRGPSGGNRQIWLVDVTSGEQIALTDDPYTNHSAVAWSPDGEKLAYMGLPSGASQSEPAIWLMDIESGENERIAIGGFLPAWLP